MHHQDFFVSISQLKAPRPVVQPLQKLLVDSVARSCPLAERSEEDLFMVSFDRMGAQIAQSADDLIRKPVLEYAVAKAKHIVDRTHKFQRPIQTRDIAMQVGDDTELQSFLPAVQPPSTIRVVPVQKLASSEARNRIALATSGGWPQRFSAWTLRIVSAYSSV